MTEEQVTKALLQHLTDNGWHIVCFDFPQSGTGRVLHPNNVIMLIFPPIAMKAKWFVVIYGLLELFFGLSGYQSGVAHFAHLGGMLWGLALLFWWRKRGKIFF